jgi:hypothetical protein
VVPFENQTGPINVSGFKKALKAILFFAIQILVVFKNGHPAE